MICIRAAITVDENTEEEIILRTKEMIKEIELSNDLDRNKVISMIFSATKDLNSVAPSKAARKMGYTNAGLMNYNEIDVVGSLNKCIRVLVFYDVDLDQSCVNHVYLREASKLRPDLI